MDVDVPLNVYVNETIQVRVTVTAAFAFNPLETNNVRFSFQLCGNKEDFLRIPIKNSFQMAVCFHGLSPIVCGDVGVDGTLGEADYTRVKSIQRFKICIF